MTEDEHNGMSWKEWHTEWLAFKAEQEARDEKLRNALAEVLDSLGAMHTMFELLPCADEKRAREHLAIDVAGLQVDLACVRRNAIPWRAVFRLANGKMLLGAVGLVVGWLGWDKAGKALEDLAK